MYVQFCQLLKYCWLKCLCRLAAEVVGDIWKHFCLFGSIVGGAKAKCKVLQTGPSDERIYVWKRLAWQCKIDHNRLHLKHNMEHFVWSSTALLESWVTLVAHVSAADPFLQFLYSEQVVRLNVQCICT